MLRRVSPVLIHNARNVSFWSGVPLGAVDPILGITEAYRKDTSPLKINVGVGAYRTDEGKPLVPRSVQAATQIIADSSLNNEYAPISGLDSMINHSLRLSYGEHYNATRIFGIQSLGGTGALRLLGEFISHHWSGEKPTVYVPIPTWGNHYAVFQESGLNVEGYRYYAPETKGLDLNGMLQDLSKRKRQVVLLHAVAHNPTGVDPSKAEWHEISAICKKQEHLVLFDNAYQGFASGNLENDVYSIRHFLAEGHNIMLAQSFSKNFGQRVGVASIMGENDDATRVGSQVKKIARAIYSNPPLHGARIVDTILSNTELTAQWEMDVKEMADRIINMRSLLRGKLEELGSPHNWEHITNQIGMFCYTGLDEEHVGKLREKHIYMTANGRISMAGVNSMNVTYLAESIHEVTRT